MRAIVCRSLTGFEDLHVEELPSPPLQPGSVRIRVRAAGVNFSDTLITKGKYQVKVEPPFTPGMEAAGEVVEVAAGVPLAVGTRVATLLDYGAYAEEIVVSAERVVPIPDAMSYETAAGFMVTYGTSHVALRHRAGLRAGETLLVHGAAGGVGLTAVEIGKRIGAKVIATASDDRKVQIARDHGADHGINTRENPEFRDEVKSLSGGRGADVVYDPIGGDIFKQSLRCIAWEGRILLIGFASGEVPQIPANHMLVKNCSAVGVYWGAYLQKDPQVLVNAHRELFAWYEEGALRPHISASYPLETGVEAIRALAERRTTGKVVITMV